MFITSQFEPHIAGKCQLMDQILEPENMRAAYHRVVRNKGKPGVDGMTVDQLKSYLNHHWSKIKETLLKGTYKPFPVLRVYIVIEFDVEIREMQEINHGAPIDSRDTPVKRLAPLLNR